jgi:hypothetical protein
MERHIKLIGRYVMKKPVILLLLLPLLVLGGCTSVPTVIGVPQGRFDIPEATGDHHGSMGVLYNDQEYGVVFTNDIANIAWDTTTPPIVTRNTKSGLIYQGLNIDLGYGLNERFEIGFDSARGLGVYGKYQILGKPRSEAEKGNFSLAVQLQLDRINQSEYMNFTSYDFSMVTSDVSILAGFRPTRQMLVYTSYFQGNGGYDGNVSGGSVPGSYSGNMKYEGYAVGLRFYFSDQAHLDLEAVDSKLTVGQSVGKNTFTGFRLGQDF